MAPILRDQPTNGPQPPVNPLVGVVDSVHIFRAGLIQLITAAGYRAATPAGDVSGWVVERKPCLTVISMHSQQDTETVARIRESSAEARILTLVESPSCSKCVAMLRLGATAVLPADVSGDRLITAIAAVLHGDSTVPREVMSVLSGGGSTAYGLSDEEVRLVRSLAQGRTISMIARRMGFSERSLHRQLTKTYLKLGARNRSEAIAEAVRRGILDLDEPPARMSEGLMHAEGRTLV